MESDESDEGYEVIINIFVNRRPRILRERKNFFLIYDETDFRFRFRVSKQVAWMVLELIRHEIKHRTPRNGEVSPEDMLLLTLRFFATGYMQRTSGDLSGVSSSTACRIVRKVCHHIALMRERFVKIPSDLNRQQELQKHFYTIAKFPHVLAALDCTHVKITSPGGNEAEIYRNRKGFFSFNVQTLCDSNLNILDVVARWPGATYDATILRNSRIYSRFESNEFKNAVVVSYSGYPLKRWIMTPLQKINTPDEALYNESQIRTRNCVERSYGVWKRRFPVLSLGIRMNVRRVEAIIVATAVLHNICNLSNDKTAPALNPDDLNAIINTEVSTRHILTNQNDNMRRREIIENHFKFL